MIYAGWKMPPILDTQLIACHTIFTAYIYDISEYQLRHVGQKRVWSEYMLEKHIRSDNG